MEQWSSQLSTWVPIRDRLSPQVLPNPHITKETPHKGELRLTSGEYPSGTKITEETGSNPYGSAAAAGDPQASRTSAVLQKWGQTVRRKTKKEKYLIINNLDVHSEIQLKISNHSDDRWINPQRWEETSTKRRKTNETRTPRLLERTKTPDQQGNKLDGEWVWWNDRIRLQKVGNEKLLWAKKNMF